MKDRVQEMNRISNKVEREMGITHGSRWISIIWGLIEFAAGFFIAGIGTGIIYYLTLLLGAGCV